ncbi:hypothetical protein [Paenibacillus cymbidii]|nr:hypothetical protein [Paenibacillus cymbidii]
MTDELLLAFEFDGKSAAKVKREIEKREIFCMIEPWQAAASALRSPPRKG